MNATIDERTGEISVIDVPESRTSTKTFYKIGQGGQLVKRSIPSDILEKVPEATLMTPEKVSSEKPSNPKDLIGTDKLPLGLVPAATMAYLTLGHLEGNLKYGLVNWREAGIRASIYVDALLRHVLKWRDSHEDEDPKTLVPHLANAITCLSIIIDAIECGKLIDDRPKSTPASTLIDRFSEKVKHLRQMFKDAKPVDYFHDGPQQRT